MSLSHANSAPLLRVEGVSKSFGNVPVLTDISLSIGAGEVVALVGENGAGKSTLMRIVGGYLRPTAGSVQFDGAPLAADMHVAQSRGVTMVHQEFALIPDMTVAENIFLGREPRKGWLIDRAAMRAASVKSLAALNCAVTPDQSMKRLPVATWQMVELAKAFSDDPRLLLMDEPTAVLGRDECEALFARIAAFRAEGGGVIFTSHRLDEVRRVADRVAVLRDGRITVEAPAAEISEDRVAAAMVGRELSDLFPRLPEAPRGEPMIAVEGLSVDRDVGEPIRGASLFVRKGEILGVAGLVGSATCALAIAPSRGGIFHSLSERFKTRNRSFKAASSVGKCPRALTARRSLEFSASIALVV